jgi:hypothetical protein
MATFLHSSIDDWTAQLQAFAAAHPHWMQITPEPVPPEVPPIPTPVEIPPVMDPPASTPPAPVRDPPISRHRRRSASGGLRRAHRFVHHAVYEVQLDDRSPGQHNDGPCVNTRSARFSNADSRRRHSRGACGTSHSSVQSYTTMRGRSVPSSGSAIGVKNQAMVSSVRTSRSWAASRRRNRGIWSWPTPPPAPRVCGTSTCRPGCTARTWRCGSPTLNTGSST